MRRKFNFKTKLIWINLGQKGDWGGIQNLFCYTLKQNLHWALITNKIYIKKLFEYWTKPSIIVENWPCKMTNMNINSIYNNVTQDFRKSLPLTKRNDT